MREKSKKSKESKNQRGVPSEELKNNIKEKVKKENQIW